MHRGYHLMLISKELLVKSGETVQVSGYYIYHKNAEAGVIPCMPTNEESVLVLEKGDTVPFISSCNNHSALYRFVVSNH